MNKIELSVSILLVTGVTGAHKDPKRETQRDIETKIDRERDRERYRVTVRGRDTEKELGLSLDLFLFPLCKEINFNRRFKQYLT